MYVLVSQRLVMNSTIKYEEDETDSLIACGQTALWTFCLNLDAAASSTGCCAGVCGPW